LPLIAPMIGACAAAFVGAWVAEVTRGAALGGATRVATGALLGRIVAVAMKVGIGIVLAVWILLALWV
jgi:uncharacterized protein